MFLEEFSELLSQYTDSHSDTVYIGDFNFHYDDCSDGQMSRRMCVCVWGWVGGGVLGEVLVASEHGA